MSSAFKKHHHERSAPVPPIGCKVSPGGLLVTSSGIASLDPLLCDGIPIGSCLAVREDSPSTYWMVIGRLFLGQGVACGQHCLIVSGSDCSSKQLLHSIPAKAESIEPSVQAKEATLSIAWRYSGNSTINSVIGGNRDSSYCIPLDISRSVPPESLAATCHTSPSFVSEEGNFFDSTFDYIQRAVEAGGYRIKGPPEPNQPILRIFLSDIGGISCGGCQDPNVAVRFFARLRGILRSSYAVCIAAVPEYLYAAHNLFPFLDGALCIMRSHAFGENNTYQGIVTVDKAFRIGTLGTNSLELDSTRKFSFRCSRKHFYLEKYHLPPAEQQGHPETACSSHAF